MIKHLSDSGNFAAQIAEIYQHAGDGIWLTCDCNLCFVGVPMDAQTAFGLDTAIQGMGGLEEKTL